MTLAPDSLAMETVLSSDLSSITIISETCGSSRQNCITCLIVFSSFNAGMITVSMGSSYLQLTDKKLRTRLMSEIAIRTVYSVYSNIGPEKALLQTSPAEKRNDFLKDSTYEWSDRFNKVKSRLRNNKRNSKRVFSRDQYK
jgi:hypothetical protein